MAISRKFDLAANTQLTVGAVAINLATYLTDKAENITLNDCDIWTIQSENVNLRVFFDGNTPTTSLGIRLLPQQVMSIRRSPDKISFISEGADTKVNLQAGEAVANFTG